MNEVLLGLVGITGPVGFASDRAADLVGSTLLAFGLLTAFVTAYFALRPAEPRASLDPSDEQRLRGLLDRARRGATRSATSRCAATRASVFSPSGKSAVTFRVVRGVSWPAATRSATPRPGRGRSRRALEQARRYAWMPAVIGCGERGGDGRGPRSGLAAYELGDEAVLDVRGVHPGRPRHARRAPGGGPRPAGRGHRHRPAARETVRRPSWPSSPAAADAWRDTAIERGFSMALSRLGDPADRDCVLVTARRPDGSLCGAAALRALGPDGLSLDLMRRDRDADNGINEFMVVALSAAARGARRRAGSR